MTTENKKTKKETKTIYVIKTQLRNTPTEKGESIEEMLRRMTTNKEPIPENVPPIYTPEKEGILPEYDIRADRFDIAMQAGDKFAASQAAKSSDTGLAFETEETKQETEQQNNE